MNSLVSFYRLGRLFPGLLVTTILLLTIDALFSSISVVTVAPLADLLLERPQDQWLGITRKISAVFDRAGVDFTPVSVAVLVWSSLLIMAITSVLIRLTTLRIRFRVVKHLLLESYQHIFAAGWGFFANINRGALINTFVREINQVGNAFQVFSASVANVVRIVAFILIPLMVAPGLVTVTIVGSLIVLFPFLLMGRWSYRYGARNVAAASRYTALVRESLEAAKEVIGLNRQTYTLSKVKSAFDRFAHYAVRVDAVRYFSSQMYEPAGFLILVIMLGMAREQGVATPVIAVALWGLIRTISPLKQTIYLKHQLDSSLPSLEVVRAQQRAAAVSSQHSGSKPFVSLESGVELKNVGFAYSPDAPVLRDVSLKIPKGKTVALVGESGSGKSTILDLLVGLQSTDQGAVLIDNVPIGDYDINTWRSKLSLVPQKPVLFDLSIKENLLWGNPDAGEQEIRRACQLTGTDRLIATLPDGLNSEVGDSGIRLSGGQLQRLALGRALIRKPELLILDEATSALDNESEKRVYQALFGLRGDITILIVAHRLSTVIDADMIYVIGDGAVLEEGDFSSLIRQNGYFKKLFEYQSYRQHA